MPVLGLAAFEREAIAARDEALELGRRGLARIAAFSHREVIRTSPTVDPDQPGSGRLRGSWTISIGSADERFAPLPAGRGQVPVPPEAVTYAVTDRVRLGDVVWIANGSPCVSTVNDRSSFVDAAIAATEAEAEQVVQELDARVVSGARAIVRARGVSDDA